MPKTPRKTLAVDAAIPQPAAPARDLLKLEEVALYAGISIDTVRREIKKQRLVATRFGKQLRVPRNELKSYLDRQATS